MQPSPRRGTTFTVLWIIAGVLVTIVVLGTAFLVRDLRARPVADRTTPPASPSTPSTPTPTPTDTTPQPTPTPVQDSPSPEPSSPEPDPETTPSPSGQDLTACRTSTYIPSMSTVTFTLGDGTRLAVKHSYRHARTVYYSVDSGPDTTVTADQLPYSALEGRLRLKLVSKLGTGIDLDGHIVSGTNTKVVLTLCGTWRQTGGNAIW
jgi:cytoskeletal protein RodZ